MIVSTRGRYALRVLVEMAEHSSDERIPLKEISEKQGISQKYMESIMTLLSKNGFVDAIHRAKEELQAQGFEQVEQICEMIMEKGGIGKEIHRL